MRFRKYNICFCILDVGDSKREKMKTWKRTISTKTENSAFGWL